MVAKLKENTMVEEHEKRWFESRAEKGKPRWRIWKQDGEMETARTLQNKRLNPINLESRQSNTALSPPHKLNIDL